MKKNFKRVLALVLAVVMVIGLTACGDKGKTTTGGKDGGKDTGKTVPLVVGYSPFSQKFSPFYAETQYDTDVINLTQVALMTTDRMGGIIKNAIEGETVNYNGTDYNYKGVADIDWKYDEGTDQTTYTATIRDDVKFSDGTPMTADDIIFTYYVYLDNSYVGSTTLGSYPIVGLQNYLLNSTAAEDVNVSEKEIADMVKNPSDEMKDFIINDVITATLQVEQTWAEESFEEREMASAEELFVTSYSLEKDYKYDGKDFATLISEIAAMYGTNYVELANRYAGDPAYFDADVLGKAEDLIKQAKVDKAGGEEVPNITGIKKTGDYSIEVITKGFDAPAVYSILGVGIAPLHYYGDKSNYDYDNNKFGFTRNDLKSVEAKMTKPLGAGPYVFKEYKNKVVYFEANKNYFLGEPKIKDMQFKEINAAEIASDIEAGTVDCGEMTGSVTRFNEVKGYNSNGELTGDVISTTLTDNLGYGYLGINANTVNVGGKPASDESKALRSGLMTVLSVYRDTAVDTYYAEGASVINYPISNTSWAAPQTTDDGYKVAYSTNPAGEPLYTSEMSADEKYATAIAAATEFFKKAGYKFDEGSGKFTAAPNGAKMSYEAIIPADGSGDHPSYGVLTDAKAALESIGIELVINDPADSNVLWDALDAGTQELWCAAWNSTVDPDMFQIYHSSGIVGRGGSDSNHYHMDDKKLDELITAARKSDDQSYRKAVYKECFDIIMDWSVELPVYQRQNIVIFSSERMNMSTLTPDITTFWKWYYDIEKLEMN
ncbi:MAG: ABC transporter substrate-binding protein [Lachnospiraceae bacterium]